MPSEGLARVESLPRTPGAHRSGAAAHLAVPYDEHLVVDGDVGMLELQQRHQLRTEGRRSGAWFPLRAAQAHFPTNTQAPSSAQGTRQASSELGWEPQGPEWVPALQAVLCDRGAVPPPL